MCLFIYDVAVAKLFTAEVEETSLFGCFMDPSIEMAMYDSPL